MDRDSIVRTMPALRQAFEDLKAALAEGRMETAGQALFGACLGWGEELGKIYAHADREALAGHDLLTRFFVTRHRGMPEPAQIAGAPPAACFLMAFIAFPYLDALMNEVGIGEHLGRDEAGNWLVSRVLAGECDGSSLAADKGGRGWRFDLMPLYQTKAKALEAFVDESFGGDFDAFLRRYVADHDLLFDREQAWRPLAETGGSHAHPCA